MTNGGKDDDVEGKESPVGGVDAVFRDADDGVGDKVDVLAMEGLEPSS